MKPLPLRIAMLAFSAMLTLPTIAPAEGSISTDRPDLTEGATVVAQRSIQLETGLNYSKTEEGTTDTSFFQTPTLLRYGVTKRVEARLETGGYTDQTVETPGQEVSASGAQPIALGVKVGIVDAAVTGGTTDVGLLINVGLPSGSEEFEQEDTDYTVKGLASFALAENVGLGLNAGVNLAKDAADDWVSTVLATAALAVSLTETVGVFGELALEAPDIEGVDAGILADAGVTWLLSPDFQLDASAGAGVSGDGVPDFFVGGGLSVRR